MVNAGILIGGLLVLGVVIAIILILVFSSGVSVDVTTSSSTSSSTSGSSTGSGAGGTPGTGTGTGTNPVSPPVSSPLYTSTTASTCSYYYDPARIWPPSLSPVPAPSCTTPDYLATTTTTRTCIDAGCTFTDGTPMAIGLSETITVPCPNPVASCTKVDLRVIIQIADGTYDWMSLILNPATLTAASTQSKNTTYAWSPTNSGTIWTFFNQDIGLYLTSSSTQPTSATPFNWDFALPPEGPLLGPAGIGQTLRSFADSTGGKYYAQVATLAEAWNQTSIVSANGHARFLSDFAANFTSTKVGMMQQQYL